jgi:hypothetical protein
MHPSTDYNSFLQLHLLLTISESSDRKHITGVASVRLTKCFPSEPVLSLRVFLKVIKISLEI